MTNIPGLDLEAVRRQAGQAPKVWDWNVSFEVRWIQKGLTESGVPHYEAEDVLNLKRGPDHICKNVEMWRGAHPTEWRLYVEPSYLRWVQTKEQPSNGTPLNMVPVLSTPTVLQLKSLNIVSAEQLVACKDELVAKVPDGLRHKEAVRRFLDAGKKSIEMTKIIKERDDLKERVEFLEGELKRLDKKFKDLGGN